MQTNPKLPEDKILDQSWRLMMTMISLLVLLCFIAFAYLLLADTIHAYRNRKVYSAEELARFQKQASLRKSEDNFDKVENGIHLRTGLHDDPQLRTIIASCTSCHSAKLITQNRATAEGWTGMIRWMQETQGLPDLGSNEKIIVNYLAKYYAPENSGRRKNLDIKQLAWYNLILSK